MTVKGLEPELKRLMAKHRDDLGKQIAGWCTSKKVLHADLDTELSKQQATLWETASGERPADEVKERALLRHYEVEIEREARKQYTATVKEQTNSSSQLRAELKEHRRHETLRCQHKQQDLQILANQRLTEVHGRLAHERGRSMHLLNQGRSVVKEARLADQAIWSKLTSLFRERAVAAAVGEATRNLARQRDITIDASIYEIQKLAFATEAEEAQAANTRCTSLKEAHIVTITELRMQRAEWADRHCSTLKTTATLRECRRGLLADEADSQHHYHRTEARAAKPRYSATCCANILKSIQLEQSQAQTKAKYILDSSVSASEAAYDAAIVCLQQTAAGHSHALTQRDQFHQALLSSKDEGVKVEFSTEDRKLMQIENAVKLEQVRHNQLQKILAGYTRDEPASCHCLLARKQLPGTGVRPS